MARRKSSRPQGRVVRVQLIHEKFLPYEHHVNGPKSAASLALTVLRDQDRETFLCIHLNTKHDVLSAEVVAVGSLSSVLVHPREVFKGAILANAAAIVVAHSHPSGHTTPSEEDLHITKQLRDAGELLGIAMHDHLIIAGERWLSLRETTTIWG